MKRMWLIPVISVVLFGGFVGWHYMKAKKVNKPAAVVQQKIQTPQKGAQSKEAQSGFTQNTFAQLQASDQETVRDLVQGVRRLGDPQATPADSSLLKIGDVHYAITSFWDPDYIRDPSVWKAPADDNLWDPQLKADILNPGAWMIAMVTENKKIDLYGVVLRWAAPPANLAPPPVSQTDPVAQALNAGWNEILKQKYPFFSFMKATAVDNKLELHFTVVKVDKPQKVVVTVPINGTDTSWSLGKVSIQDE